MYLVIEMILKDIWVNHFCHKLKLVKKSKEIFNFFTLQSFILNIYVNLHSTDFSSS